VTNIQTDLSDGIFLINLLHALWGVPNPHFILNPFNYEQKLENVEMAYVMAAHAGMTRISEWIPPELIVSGDVGATLNLVWTILMYSDFKRFLPEQPVEASITAMTNDVTRQMTHWMKRRLEGYPDVPPVSDMSDSFRSGHVLCALVHFMRNDSIPIAKIDPKRAADNIALALDKARVVLKLPVLLDAEDLLMPGGPDPLCMLSLLAEFLKYYRLKWGRTGFDPKGPQPGMGGPQYPGAMVGGQYLPVNAQVITLGPGGIQKVGTVSQDGTLQEATAPAADTGSTKKAKKGPKSGGKKGKGLLGTLRRGNKKGVAYSSSEESSDDTQSRGAPETPEEAAAAIRRDASESAKKARKGKKKKSNAEAVKAAARGVDSDDEGEEGPEGKLGRFPWEIKYDDIKMSKKIGRGAFGVVYKGKWRMQTVAVKQLNTGGKEMTQKQYDEFFGECEVMMSLRPHKNIAQLLGVSVDPSKPLCIVTDFYANGSLFDFIMSDKQFGWDFVIRALEGVTAGMYHLHSESILHRDLAARNILLSEALEAKVSDFGLSKKVLQPQEDQQESFFRGAFKYMAPESLARNVFSTKTDVWSFGVTVWEVITRKAPFTELDLYAAAKKIKKGLRLPIPDDCPASVAGLMNACWYIDPDARPEFDELSVYFETIRSEYRNYTAKLPLYPKPIKVKEKKPPAAPEPQAGA
jgi:hypothetical protein